MLKSKMVKWVLCDVTVVIALWRSSVIPIISSPSIISLFFLSFPGHLTWSLLNNVIFDYNFINSVGIVKRCNFTCIHVVLILKMKINASKITFQLISITQMNSSAESYKHHEPKKSKTGNCSQKWRYLAEIKLSDPEKIRNRLLVRPKFFIM